MSNGNTKYTNPTCTYTSNLENLQCIISGEMVPLNKQIRKGQGAIASNIIINNNKYLPVVNNTKHTDIAIAY